MRVILLSVLIATPAFAQPSEIGWDQVERLRAAAGSCHDDSMRGTGHHVPDPHRELLHLLDNMLAIDPASCPGTPRGRGCGAARPARRTRAWRSRSRPPRTGLARRRAGPGHGARSRPRRPLWPHALAPRRRAAAAAPLERGRARRLAGQARDDRLAPGTQRHGIRSDPALAHPGGGAASPPRPALVRCRSRHRPAREWPGVRRPWMPDCG